MKKFFLMAVLMSGFLSPAMLADDPPNPPKNDSGTSPGTSTPVTIKPRNPKPDNKPKSPFEQYVDCWYDGENLVFNFLRSEGMCSLTVSEIEKGSVAWYTFDSSSEAVVYVGEIWNATILIDTSIGNSYEGFLGE